MCQGEEAGGKQSWAGCGQWRGERQQPFDPKQWGAPLRNVNTGKESVGSPAFSSELGMRRAEPHTPVFYFIQILRLVHLHNTDRKCCSLARKIPSCTNFIPLD